MFISCSNSCSVDCPDMTEKNVYWNGKLRQKHTCSVVLSITHFCHNFRIVIVLGHRFRVNNFFQRKILNIFLSVSFNICFAAQKNRLIETVLLSTHNICFA